MIRVTLEFNGVDEAIVALHKLVAAPGRALTADVGTQSPAAAASPRRGRSDKGQKRGEYKPRQEPKDAGVVIPTPTVEDFAAPPVVATPEAGAAAPSVASTAESPAPAGAAPTIGDKDAEAQAVLESVLAKRNVNDALALLSRYGAKKLRDVPKSVRDEFLQHAKLVAQGGAI